MKRGLSYSRATICGFLGATFNAKWTQIKEYRNPATILPAFGMDRAAKIIRVRCVWSTL